MGNRFSAIYRHIAIPLGDAVERVCRLSEIAKKCDKELGGCLSAMPEMPSGRNSPTGVTGGYQTLYDCARGLVSARCGGNPIGPGGTGDWKPPGGGGKQ